MAPQPILDSYADYDCKVNDIDVLELFRLYEKCGFIYIDKLDHLIPYFVEIRNNWERAMAAGEDLIAVVTCGDPETASWGSITAWRTTLHGWQTQHLVSFGDPLRSRSVMLARIAVLLNQKKVHADQAWFQPTNRFTNRVFGSIVEVVGADSGCVNTMESLTISRTTLPEADIPSRVQVERATSEHLSEIASICGKVRGKVWLQGEGLDQDDIDLESLDEIYRKANLRRYRRVYLAYRESSDQPIGAAIVYRGPLGFSFSFLENRCELVIDPDLDEAVAREVIVALLHRSSLDYEDFSPDVIPIITDHATAESLEAMGAQRFKTYSQSMWLSDGLEPTYRHVERFYDRLARVGARHGLHAPNWVNRSNFVKTDEDGNIETREDS